MVTASIWPSIIYKALAFANPSPLSAAGRSLAT